MVDRVHHAVQHAVVRRAPQVRLQIVGSEEARRAGQLPPAGDDGAVFVDGGSAFDGQLNRWRTGVGIGVRWKSPVGPLRIDIGRGLDDPDSSFTLHLNIGAEL